MTGTARPPLLRRSRAPLPAPCDALPGSRLHSRHPARRDPHPPGSWLSGGGGEAPRRGRRVLGGTSSKLDPLLATLVGDARYDDRLPDALSDEGREAIRQLAVRTRASLEAIPRAELRGEDVFTWAVLDEQTRTTLDGLPHDDHLMPLDSLNSIALQMPVLGSGVGVQPFRTVRDYDNFLARIRAFSSWADLAIARSREGIEQGVHPAEAGGPSAPAAAGSARSSPARRTAPSGDRWSGCRPRSRRRIANG